MKKSIKTPLAAALGAAFVSSIAFTTAVSADTNPFGATELETGYMVLAEGKCGEGKCGEGKCGAEKAAGKAKEAKCGEGKCGAEKAADKAKEAKCAEGKCAEGKCAAAK
jgi:uncharacterized low-complexity protein